MHMQSSAGVAIRVVCYGLAAAVLAVALNGMPSVASAAEVTTISNQILPISQQNTCTPVQATNFTPYVYDGALNSLEFTMPDSSYVAIVGKIGDTSIPLHYMTRRVESNGLLRIHVDTPSIPVSGTLPVEITMLSAQGAGAPICLTVVSTSLTGTAAPAAPVQPQSAQPTAPTTPAAPTTTTQPTTSTSNTSSSNNTGASATPTAVTTAAPTAGVTQSGLGGMCSTAQGAYRLWLVLLVLYVLVLAAVLWPEWPSSWEWLRTPRYTSTWIVAPAVLLVLFWLVIPVCRGAIWMPIVAVLFGAAALFAAFRNHPRVAQLLLLEEKKGGPIIVTPPPQQKQQPQQQPQQQQPKK